MNIREAMDVAYKGLSVRREAWRACNLFVGVRAISPSNTKDLYLFDSGNPSYYTANAADLLADDWEVIYDRVTFDKALVALREGKHIAREGWLKSLRAHLDMSSGNLRFVAAREDGVEAESHWAPQVNDILATDWVVLITREA